MPRLHSAWKSVFALAALLALTLLLSGCGTIASMFGVAATPPPLERLVPEVIAVTPHDIGSFTEGFEYHDGKLYESAGRYGESDFREVDLATGEVLRQVDLGDEYFGEGIALVEDQFLQLTWREAAGFRYDRDTLEQVGTFTFTGEGWGMCYDGTNVYTSDGSDKLQVHNPDSFAVTQLVAVTFEDQPINMINELECVGDDIYANVWQTDAIIRIDKATGDITGLIDARGLLTTEETAALGAGGVLNGIAYVPERDTFLLTGKLWPKTFEVRFVPQSAG
jgi:glutaminyl-peptide cyclotransferase